MFAEKQAIYPWYFIGNNAIKAVVLGLFINYVSYRHCLSSLCKFKEEEKKISFDTFNVKFVDFLPGYYYAHNVIIYIREGASYIKSLPEFVMTLHSLMAQSGIEFSGT